MDDVRLIDAKTLESKLIAEASGIKGKSRFDKGESWGFELAAKMISHIPTIDPESLRPVAHWEEIPGSYKDHIGKDGSWFVPATRCTNPECREINPCSLKTPFCPMCGARMEDVPHD